MGRSSSKDKGPLSAAKQLEFHPLLAAARKTKLAPAVSEAASECSQAKLRAEIAKLGDRRVLKLAAAAGIRDEHVIAVPCLLRQKPTVIGYYRLLAGISKKQFYHGSGGFGAQLDGAYRVKIGEAAAQEVFALVGELLRKHVTSASAKRLELADATATRVVIRRAGDPDIQITREDGSSRPRKIAIEIKGGRDLSNAHNRAGEAEKSHVKARISHATDFWTIASLPKKRLHEFKAQSPTTNLWFDLSEVLGRSGPSWDEFRTQLASAVGVRLA